MKKLVIALFSISVFVFSAYGTDYYYDHFNSGFLDSKWSVEDTGSYSLGKTKMYSNYLVIENTGLGDWDVHNCFEQNSDNVTFVYQKLKGDFSVQIRVILPPSSDFNLKYISGAQVQGSGGLMIRESTYSKDKYFAVFFSYQGSSASTSSNLSIQYYFRTTKDEDNMDDGHRGKLSVYTGSDKTNLLRIDKEGDKISGYYSADNGKTWNLIYSTTIEFSETYYLGPFSYAGISKNDANGKYYAFGFDDFGESVKPDVTSYVQYDTFTTLPIYLSIYGKYFGAESSDITSICLRHISSNFTVSIQDYTWVDSGTIKLTVPLITDNFPEGDYDFIVQTKWFDDTTDIHTTKKFPLTVDLLNAVQDISFSGAKIPVQDDSSINVNIQYYLSMNTGYVPVVALSNFNGFLYDISSYVNSGSWSSDGKSFSFALPSNALNDNSYTIIVRTNNMIDTYNRHLKNEFKKKYALIVDKQKLLDDNYVWFPSVLKFNDEENFSTAQLLINGANGKKLEVFIYSLDGGKVRDLYNDTMDNDSVVIQWDGKNNNLVKVKAGIYFAVIYIDGKKYISKVLTVIN